MKQKITSNHSNKFAGGKPSLTANSNDHKSAIMDLKLNHKRSRHMLRCEDVFLVSVITNLLLQININKRGNDKIKRLLIIFCYFCF